MRSLAVFLLLSLLSSCVCGASSIPSPAPVPGTCSILSYGMKLRGLTGFYSGVIFEVRDAPYAVPVYNSTTKKFDRVWKINLSLVQTRGVDTVTFMCEDLNELQLQGD